MGIRYLSPIVWISLDIITKVFIRGKPKYSWEEEQCDNGSRDWVMLFKDGGRGRKPRNTGSLRS